MLQKSLLRLNLLVLCVLGTGREEQLMVKKMYDALQVGKDGCGHGFCLTFLLEADFTVVVSGLRVSGLWDLCCSEHTWKLRHVFLNVAGLELRTGHGIHH